MCVIDKLKKMNILLVDNDEWIRDSLSVFFKTKGCCLRAVESAEAGMAEMGRKGYDIVLADYLLPGMSGLEFLRRIQHSYPAICKILISSYGDRELYSQAREMGIKDIIEKPFNMEKIKTSLFRALEKAA